MPGIPGWPRVALLLRVAVLLRGLRRLLGVSVRLLRGLRGLRLLRVAVAGLRLRRDGRLLAVRGLRRLLRLLAVRVVRVAETHLLFSSVGSVGDDAA